jgi:hypothetical protein
MPAATIGGGGAMPAQQQGPAANPFMGATWEYTEPMNAQAVTPSATVQTFTTNITPSGFLRGITLDVSTTTVGSGLTASADAPWNLFGSISLVNVDGDDILYPGLTGYSWYVVSKFCRPWDEDPAQDPDFTNSATTLAFRIRFFCEARASIGVRANTDARAQYRLQYTINPSTTIWTATTTIPVLQVLPYLETYAQPDATDAMGTPNGQVPPGVVLQRAVSNEIGNTSAGTNTYKINRVGNLIRSHILVFRASGGARTDLTSDPIQLRKDNTTLWNQTRSRVDYETFRFFGPQGVGSGTQAVRPTGVYVFPRWHQPGIRQGNPWLQSTQATFLQYTFNGAPAGGTVEVITEDLAPTVPQLPAHLKDL